MSDLHAAALDCLMLSDPAEKRAATERVAALHRQGTLNPGPSRAAVRAVPAPGRPARPLLVPPRQLAQRGLGTAAGRAALVHAVAHIEFNAINLAWDAVYRFRDMPAAFYADWIAVAADEARHFGMLAGRLAELGHAYGDFDAHNGLWEMALLTADSCLQRMALVPRVLEARGLDVTPGMIDRLRSVGDEATVAILETILREEVAHVAAGSRWFVWCCAQVGCEPQATFRDLIARHLPGGLRGPFNTDARLLAGFSVEEMTGLMERAA